jgi:hypothetical protein
MSNILEQPFPADLPPLPTGFIYLGAQDNPLPFPSCHPRVIDEYNLVNLDPEHDVIQIYRRNDWFTACGCGVYKHLAIRADSIIAHLNGISTGLGTTPSEHEF